jgi:peptide/nickel transport system substrate-binding protein
MGHIEPEPVSRPEGKPMTSPHWTDLVDAFRNGDLSRRTFLRRATAAGISVGAATIVANQVSAQDATPAASPAASAGSATGVANPGGHSFNREEFEQVIRENFDLTEPEVTGGQVIYGESSDIDTMNPQLHGDTYSGYVNGMVYEYLVSTNPTNGFPAPGLADFWELAEDGITYTFHLNPNATWHDGEPLTADDVVFSFDSTLDESSLSVRRSSVSLALESYRAVDDHTVELVATSPLAVFVQNTAGLVGIVPKHIWQDVPPADWGSDPGSVGTDPARVIGSGPMKFGERVVGEYVTLLRNDDYWDANRLPNIDEFTYRYIPEASAATAALTTAETDSTILPVSEAEILAEDPNLTVESYDNAGFIWLDINQDEAKTPLFVDIPVRQALMYSLDRDLMSEQVYMGFNITANGTQPLLSIAYAPDRINTIYTYDPEQAKALLEEAGWVDADGDGVREKDGTPFRFECMYSDGDATQEQALAYMQQAWGEVGIEMTPVPTPFQTKRDAGITGDYEMRLSGFAWGTDGDQGDMFRCDAVPPNGFNNMRYCNERYDELDALQQAELDVDKRIDILIEQSNIANDEVATGVLFFRKSVIGSRTTLHNFLPNGYSFLWSMPWWWTEVQ